ncbi:MAG TPA: hypothetical protein VGF20_14285 [Candidatus Acidoferrum sp.]
MNTFRFDDQQFAFSRISRWFAISAVAASLALLSTPGAGAQDSQQDSSQQQPDDQQGPSPQDHRKVISRDDIQQNNQDPQDQDQNNPNQRPPRSFRRQYNEQRPFGDVPASITVPAGKVIFVRLNEPLSSDHNNVGDTFTATLDQPIVINGWVVARRGQTVVGTVTAAQKAGRVKGVSQLGLTLTDITVVDGNQVPISSEFWRGSAGTSHGADAAGIATTTGVGAGIGAIAGGGVGAGIGAGAGAVAGIVGVLVTRGKPTVLGPETQLSFRIKEPLAISTENSTQAFQPVGDDDYNGSQGLRRRGGPYPAGAPAPYYAGYGYPYYGYPYYGYWGPSVGFYYGGGYWGRGYYGHYGYGYGRGFGHAGYHH